MRNQQNKIIIGLLSHYFSDNNLGCVALSICNVQLIDRAAARLGVDIAYIVYVNEKQPHWDLSCYTQNEYEYRIFSSSKQTLRHPLKFFKTGIFAGCEIVFNLCAGDGFTDIYGFGRVLSETYMTVLASMKGSKVVLSPQTIGPFRSRLTRTIAKHTLKRCEYVFARDGQSADFCKELGYADKVEEVIDVAFALPYDKPSADKGECSGLNIGLNVSGLLYAGGYDHNNYFGLSFDYGKYINKLISALISSGYTVHLIAHVITPDASIEDDFVVCKMLKEKYPKVILMPRSESPIVVKSYIASMDAFVGARMHSTIGAFSSGVPVIPVAYSRKFNGLYETLGYPYYIDARSAIGLDEAVERTLSLAANRAILAEAIRQSTPVYEKRLNEFVASLTELLGECDAI